MPHRTASTLLALLLLLGAAQAQAANASISLEGRLFDLLGEPVTGQHTLTFFFFDDGATTDPSNALWFDDFDVQLDQGYYTVQLGAEGQQPLDSLLFVANLENLWFGMSVDNGPVLEPTLPVTGSPFAMLAHHLAGRTEHQQPLVLFDDEPIIDAEGRFVGGVNATSLSVNGVLLFDQDGQLRRVLDLPAGTTISGEELATLEHLSSANFISGIVGETAETNPSNHLRYTDAEALQAVIADFGGLDDNNARYHNRYSDPEAVAAVELAFGALADTNPRNHSRYSDDEARAAVDGLYLSLGGGTLGGPLVLEDASAAASLGWNAGVDGVEWAFQLDGEDLVLVEPDGGGIVHMRVTDAGSVEILPDGNPAIVASPNGDVAIAGALTVENLGLGADALVVYGHTQANGDLTVSGSVRSACPSGLTGLGGFCIDSVQQGPSDLGTSVAGCVARGLRLCPFDALLTCDLAGAPGAACTVATDAPGTTVRTSSPGGTSTFTLLGYKGDDTHFATTAAENLPYFCCQTVLPE